MRINTAPCDMSVNIKATFLNTSVRHMDRTLQPPRERNDLTTTQED